MCRKSAIFVFVSFCLGFTLTSFSLNNSFSSIDDNKHISIVVIDPGHGGKDTGAAVGSDFEKDIVLDMGLRIGEMIKKKYPDIKVIYTRKTDVFIPLYERANIANKNKADLFISIHVNGAERTDVYGTETFVLGEHRSKDNFEVVKKENSVILLEDNYQTTYEGFDPNSPESYIMFEFVQSEYLEQSIMLASSIQKQFRDYAKRSDRSVKQAGFLVLRQTAMPSVLVELGFITNKNERGFLTSETGKSTLATSIFKAFDNYKLKIENKSSFSMRTEGAEMAKSVAEMKDEIIESKEIIKENPKVKNDDSDIYFSIQIAASVKNIETKPSNFKGQKDVFMVKVGKMYKYYVGKFEKIEDVNREKQNTEKKFPEAFIVAFENNEIIPVKKALEKNNKEN